MSGGVRGPWRAATGVSPSRLVRIARTVLTARGTRRAAASRMLAVLVALCVAAAVGTQMGRARAATEAWGSTRPAAVAARALERGHELGPEDVVVRELPAGLLPAGSLGRAPLGRRVTAALAAGEVLTETRLEDPDEPGGRLGPDGRAALVSIPLDAVGTVAAPLEPGDLVEVHGLVERGAGGARIVVRGGEVLQRAEGRIVLRIDRPDAPALAAAVLAGPLFVVRVG